MIIWFKHLPQVKIDDLKWRPFIINDWFRHHYMKFVYLLQLTILCIPFIFYVPFSKYNLLLLFIIAILSFICHEILHILVVHKRGDISLTFSGIFFWLNVDAVLTKKRFLTFMSLPFISLSVVPVILSIFISGDFQVILLFISWINAFYSGSDIINTFLILRKPNNALFYRGYYKTP